MDHLVHTTTTATLAKRIVTKIQAGDIDVDGVEHMLLSLIRRRDKKIATLQTKVKPRMFKMTQKIVTGAVKNTIDCHGPITPQFIDSAAKRIYKQCIHIVPEGAE